MNTSTIISLHFSRAALIEAKKQEKAAELEKRKMEEKQEKEKLPDFRCPTCLKQFNDNDSFRTHNFDVSFDVYILTAEIHIVFK